MLQSVDPLVVHQGERVDREGAFERAVTPFGGFLALVLDEDPAASFSSTLWFVRSANQPSAFAASYSASSSKNQVSSGLPVSGLVSRYRFG
ncbi:hypothetical protein [Frankia canadensis]|uniref:hypothetical protein n=1 Tax=Frankia canadensis TaxID=1836972 RepID=UPI000C79BCBC|nr:hypothetical protein [Frankia canadensis]